MGWAERGCVRACVAMQQLGSKIPAIELDLGFPPEKVDLAKRVAGKKVRVHTARSPPIAACLWLSFVPWQRWPAARCVAASQSAPARPQVILVGLPGAFTPT